MKRSFVINRQYKEYWVRNHHFAPQPNGGCRLETDDPEVIRLITGADGYGVFIHPGETAEEIKAMEEADKRHERTVPRYPLNETEPEHPPPLEPDPMPPVPPVEPEEEKKNEEETGTPEEDKDEEEEEAPIAHQGARGTHTGRGQRKGQFITPKEK